MHIIEYKREVINFVVDALSRALLLGQALQGNSDLAGLANATTIIPDSWKGTSGEQGRTLGCPAVR